MRLRQYKSIDSKTIEKWIQDEDVFTMWGGEHLGEYPIDACVLNDKYTKDNGCCSEEDNFYPWTAVDDDGNVVGHFIMRYPGGDPDVIRFGWVIVDTKVRGKGYGKKMLAAGLKYAFEVYGAKKITIGVFENNDPAHYCYKAVGFKDKETVNLEPYNVIEMELTREEYETR